jgi:hypothetical protein
MSGGLLYSKEKYYKSNQPYKEQFLQSSVKEMETFQTPELDESAFKQVHSSRGTSVSNTDGLKQSETVKVGGNTITVTDPYGIRSFEGRENQHSTGIDMVTSSGKVVAMMDGVIETVKLEGDGSVITPVQGSKAGYYLVVKNSDGTKAQYMHLDPMSPEEMKSLAGKKIKRGDEIWGYQTGSGSITGPHVKYRVYTGKSGYNSHIDPSAYIRGIIGKAAATGEANGVSPSKEDVYAYLTGDKGLSKNHALGLIANGDRESGWNTDIAGDSGTSNGIFQWHNQRYTNLKTSVPDWKTNWKGQIDYALTESVGPNYVAQDFSTAEAAADYWMTKWERPANTTDSRAKNNRFIASYNF